MKKNSLTTAVVAGIAGVAGFAGLANAVHLNPDGIGQVLLYPYYTVNNQQQTLLSVVNTTNRAKAVKVRFLEGYNTREVLDFNLFLSKYDVWTAAIFALSDAGKPGDGAAVLTRDKSCTSPEFSEEGTSLADGTPYVAFRDFAYMTPSDGGPSTIDRTREGHFEIISMADVVGSTAVDITHVNGVPADCSSVRSLTGAESDLVPPTSGLFGAAGVINGQEGTFFAYNADALERFTFTTLFSSPSSILPNLSQVNDGSTPALNAQATSNVFTGTGAITSTYPSALPNSRKIDAVTSIFTVNAIFNEYGTDTAINAGSDWVVTFPTKAFYVDKLYIGASATAAIPPFLRVYNGAASASPRFSCVAVGLSIYDREEKTTGSSLPGFSPPPPGAPPSSLCKEVNVISFLNVGTAPTESGVLGSRLVTNVKPLVGANGWLRVDMDPSTEPHAIIASTQGNVFRGLPVSGFWASNVVNNNATVVNGVQTLGNYSGVFKHRASRNCVNAQNTAGGQACS